MCVVHDLFMAECDTCDAGHFAEPTQEEAAKAWNTRASGWMPIETAPRDETSVDLWVKSDFISYRLTDAWWCSDGECWYARGSYGDTEPLTDGTPTHWIPIPKAPEVPE
jgi:hypothetical protein